MNHRGMWIVCVRDIPSGEDDYLGPFASEEKAHTVARMLNRDIAARGAQGSVDAIVEWVRPGVQVTEYREQMLADFDRDGWRVIPVEQRVAADG